MVALHFLFFTPFFFPQASSRSHSIFILTLEQTNSQDGSKKKSKVHAFIVHCEWNVFSLYRICALSVCVCARTHTLTHSLTHTFVPSSSWWIWRARKQSKRPALKGRRSRRLRYVHMCIYTHTIITWLTLRTVLWHCVHACFAYLTTEHRRSTSRSLRSATSSSPYQKARLASC